MSLTVPGPSRFEASRRESVLAGPGVIAVVIGALTLLAFGLRLSQIHQSIIEDEVSTYYDIFRHSFGSVLSTVHTGSENSPPLYFLLAWLTSKLGDATVWIRLPSVVLGAATVPVVYAIGRETVGRLPGVIAAAIVAVAPFAVFYGIEARPYATMAFFVALSTLALLRAVETQSTGWWLLYVGAAVAAAYSHYTSIFLLGAQAVWSLWFCRDRIRAPLLANALIVLLYLPWLPHLRGKALAVIGSLYPLTAKHVLTDLLRPIPGHPAASLRAIPTITGIVIIAASVIAGVIALVLRRRREAGPSPGLGLLLVLTAATPIGLLVYSLIGTDLWLPRGLSASLPAAALVVGTLLAALPRPLTILTVVLVLATLLLGTVRSFGPNYTRGPFRSIASYLDRVAGPRAPVQLFTVLGAPAISAQFHRQHLVVPSLTRFWRLVPAGTDVYVVSDKLTLRAAGAGGPRPAGGFRLVGRRRYGGAFPTDILIYGRQR